MHDRVDGEYDLRRRALARELRAISELLSVADPDGSALEESTELARAMRRRLEGPRRPRWYDGDTGRAGKRADSRGAYQDQSPIRGQVNPIAPPLQLRVAERPDGTPIVQGRARLGMAYEGPPHGVHGGWVAALFDDLLGATQGLIGASGVTAVLEVKFRRVTPVNECLHFEGWIEQSRGRRIVARGTCHAGDVLTAEAKGLFVRVDFDALRRTPSQSLVDGGVGSV